MHLTPNSCVVSLLKMLTYCRVCSAFSSTHALLLNVIYIFKIAFFNYIMCPGIANLAWLVEHYNFRKNKCEIPHIIAGLSILICNN